MNPFLLLLLQTMERSMDGDTQQDIFKPDAPGFEWSSLTAVAVVAFLSILGTAYQLVKWSRGKVRGPGKGQVINNLTNL